MIALAFAAKVVIFLMAAFVFFWALANFCRDPQATARFLGLGPNYLVKHFSVGFALAFAAMTVMAFTNWVCGAVEFTGYEGVDQALVRTIVLIVVVSFGEELVFRAFCLSGLRAITRSDLLSVLVMSLLFGCYHASNPSAGLLSILGNGAGGAMYACAFLWSRSVWLPTGLHIGWNLFQGPLWGFPVSGLDFSSIFVQRYRTDVPVEILSGGSYGPEASLLGVAMRLLVILALWMLLQNRTVGLHAE